VVVSATVLVGTPLTQVESVEALINKHYLYLYNFIIELEFHYI